MTHPINRASRHRQTGAAGRGWLTLFAGLAAVTLALALPVDGKEIFLGKRGFIEEDPGDGGKAAQVAEFPDGATLPTDSEVDRILKRAEEYVTEGRFDLASVVWQKVLDGTTSVMRTSDGQYYTSVQVYVEDMLDRVARTAPHGLKEYRVKADAEARELIAQAKGKDEEKALADVVRRYFYSSLGDDAAYTLGCLMLDRYEFVAAARLFSNILLRHPDYTTKTDAAPNLNRAELWLRLAVATARTGDATTAKAAIAEHAKVASTTASSEVLAWVNDMIAGGGGGVEIVGTPPGEWLMHLGSTSHDGRMTGLPADTKYTGVWQEKWIARFSDGGFGLNAPQGAVATSPQPRIAVIGGGRAITRTPAGATPAATGSFDSRRRATVKKWETSDWVPADSLLMHAGRIYFRAYDRVVCVDGRTGKSVFASPSRVMPQVRPYQPSSAEEVLLFGDRASNTMMINDGVLYYIEEDNGGHMQNSNTFHRNRAGITAFRPQLATRIVALDARNGKKQWQTEPSPDDSGNRRPVRYHAAPVPYGNLLLCPVFDNGALWLYAHRADKKGELAWKSFLADDPPGGYNPWTSTGLAVAGGDAYLVSGGVVFNVDATGGLVRWAARYNRDLDGTTRRNPYGNQQSPTGRGWDDDTIIPYGRSLIVMANDRDAIVSLDRRNGRKLWEVERDGATNVLGVMGRNLYVTDRGRIRRYDLLGGALGREVELEKAITGRGFVAEDAIYLPMGNAVMRYHPTTLKRLSAVGVALPINDSEGRFDYNDPLGNIYSDGQRIYGVGMERAYALGSIERAKIDSSEAGLIDSDIATPISLRKESTGDANIDILLDHGVEPTAKALAKYMEDLHPSPETKAKIDLVIRQLGDDDYNKRQLAQATLLSMPVVPVEAIVAAMERGPDEEVRSAAARIFAATDGKRARVLYAALSTIRKKEIKGLASQTLAAIPLCTQQYLLETAGQALRATATDADGELLRKAAGDNSPEVRIVAAGAISAALKAKGVPDLRTLAQDKEERVRLGAARALADQGDRGSMDVFAALLESDNVHIRSAAARSLRAFTGQQIDFIPYDETEKRKVGIAKWKAWIAGDGKTAKLVFPLSDVKIQIGRTLVANYRTGRVYEYDAGGSETWAINVANPWGVLGLPNGHRIVSSYTQRNVVEYNDKGEKVWEQTNLPSAPFSVERLENGNTLVACSNSNRVVEVDSANKIVWDVTVMGRPTEARRLPNGRTLIALQNSNRIVEVNSEGKEEWKIEGLGAPLSAQRLANGNTLVAEVSGNRVREFDPDGKEVWNLAQMAGRNVQTPYYAERLENGNTLVADATGIREVSAKGDVISEKLDQGVSRVSKY